MASEPDKTRPERPKVALVVAAYNAEKVLDRCIEGLVRQGPDQIIVVNDGSTDSTAERLNAYGEIQAIHLPANGGVGNARNVGIESVEEGMEYIGFVDSDIVLEDGWLTTLLEEVDWDTYSAACGRIRAADEGHHWAATLDEAETSKRFGTIPRSLEPPWREVMYFNYLFRSSVFDAVRCFDPRFRTNAEDSDFFYRCAEKGVRFFYQPKARGLHCYSRPTLGGWLKRCYRNGFYTMQFHRKNRTPLHRFKILKAWGLSLLVLLVLLSPLFLGALNACLLVGAGFLLGGVVHGIRLGWRPVWGGWIGLLGWFAKGLGEFYGMFQGE